MKEYGTRSKSRWASGKLATQHLFNVMDKRRKSMLPFVFSHMNGFLNEKAMIPFMSSRRLNWPLIRHSWRLSPWQQRCRDVILLKTAFVLQKWNYRLTNSFDDSAELLFLQFSFPTNCCASDLHTYSEVRPWKPVKTSERIAVLEANYFGQSFPLQVFLFSDSLPDDQQRLRTLKK